MAAVATTASASPLTVAKMLAAHLSDGSPAGYNSAVSNLMQAINDLSAKKEALCQNADGVAYDDAVSNLMQVIGVLSVKKEALRQHGAVLAPITVPTTVPVGAVPAPSPVSAAATSSSSSTHQQEPVKKDVRPFREQVLENAMVRSTVTMNAGLVHLLLVSEDNAGLFMWVMDEWAALHRMLTNLDNLNVDTVSLRALLMHVDRVGAHVDGLMSLMASVTEAMSKSLRAQVLPSMPWVDEVGLGQQRALPVIDAKKDTQVLMKDLKSTLEEIVKLASTVSTSLSFPAQSVMSLGTRQKMCEQLKKQPMLLACAFASTAVYTRGLQTLLNDALAILLHLNLLF